MNQMSLDCTEWNSGRRVCFTWFCGYRLRCQLNGICA